MKKKDPPKEPIQVTPGQLAVFDAICAFIKEHGYSPALRDLCKMLKLSSTNGMAEHLTSLTAAGAVSMQPKISRSIVVLVNREQLVVREGHAAWRASSPDDWAKMQAMFDSGSSIAAVMRECGCAIGLARAIYAEWRRA